MKTSKIVQQNDLLIRELSVVVSKSLVKLGDKKHELPWFASSILKSNNSTLEKVA